jgi:hypothetical protein
MKTKTRRKKALLVGVAVFMLFCLVDIGYNSFHQGEANTKRQGGAPARLFRRLTHSARIPSLPETNSESCSGRRLRQMYVRRCTEIFQGQPKSFSKLTAT